MRRHGGLIGKDMAGDPQKWRPEYIHCVDHQYMAESHSIMQLSLHNGDCASSEKDFTRTEASILQVYILSTEDTFHIDSEAIQRHDLQALCGLQRIFEIAEKQPNPLLG
jgi:hypothetical protein